MSSSNYWQHIADKLKHIPNYLIDHIVQELILAGVIAGVELVRKDGVPSMKKVAKALVKGLAQSAYLATAFAVLEK